MHNSGTISCPFPRIKIPTGKKILPTMLTFEVKLTNILDFYEIKVKMCANRSKMVHGLDYTTSYAPTIDAYLFILSLNIAASDEMIVVFVDVSNEFQTNLISDSKKRV